MRLLLAALVVSITVTAVCAQECYDDPSICREDECCLQTECAKRRTEGETCKIDKLPWKQDVHAGNCPCIEGLRCAAIEGFVGAVCEAKSCVLDPSVCSEDECCVRQRGASPLAGECKKRKSQDETCSVRPMKSQQKDVYFSVCPCMEGHKCVPRETLGGNSLGTCQDESQQEE